MRVLSADLTRFTTAGFGTLRGPEITGLRPGDTVAVTDDDADIVLAEVLAVRAGEIDVRIHWDRTTHRRPGQMADTSTEPGPEVPAPSVPLDQLIKELGFDPADFEKPESGGDRVAT